MEQIRVSTFAGPGALPVIHTVPRPKISSKAALIKIGALRRLWHRSAHPKGSLAEATSLAVHPRP